jgi:MFS family permease
MCKANGLSASAPTYTRYRVLAALCAVAAIAYIHRNPIGVAESTIRRELDLSDEQMGAVMSAFFTSYAICQIPSGWLGQIWGARRCLSLFSLLGSAAMAMFGLSPDWAGLMAARLSMGAAQAGLFPCSASSLTHWFPTTRRALASGSLGCFMSVGSVVGAFLTGLLLEYLGWRQVFVLYSVPGVFWAIWFYLWYRDHPREHPAVNAAELAAIGQGDGASEPGKANHSPERTPWRRIVTSPAMWCICLQQYFRAAGYTFYVSWFPTFLQKTHGVTVTESGFLTSIPLLAVMVGSVGGGLLSDWLVSRAGSRRVGRQGLAIATHAAAAFLILLAYLPDDTRSVITVLGVASLLASIGGPCAYAITMDMGGRFVAPVFSTMNMAGNLGAMTFPVIVPMVVKWTGTWNSLLLVFAGIYFLAALFWVPFNPDETIA